MLNQIQIKHVTKEMRGQTVLSDINLTLEAGKAYGLCGYNGSGKTMLLRMIAGLIRPTSGEVWVDDKCLHKDLDFPQNMGVLIENPGFWGNYTAEETLYALAQIQKKVGMDEIEKNIARVGLTPGDKRTIRKFSLGMKKRLGIAQAILEQPDILLLDEPSNALDKRGVVLSHEIMQEEKARGALIVVASHQPEDLAICDVIYEMEEGKIVEVRQA